MFDHIALGIELPGPLVAQEKWYRSMMLRKRALKLRFSGNASDMQTSLYIIDPDFDDPPQFTLAEPELPHPPGADQ